MVNVINVLNELIAVCNDNVESFEEAAEQIKSPELQAFFNELTEHWKTILQALRVQVIYCDGIPEEGGTLVGDAHRLYAKFKATVLTNERKAILDELEPLSSRALAKFEDVSSHELPPQVEGIVRLQCGQAREAHERILELRKSYR